MMKRNYPPGKHLLILLLLLAVTGSLHAQQSFRMPTPLEVQAWKDTVGWITPDVIGDRRSKFVSVSYDRILPFSIESEPDEKLEELGNGKARLNKLDQLETKLRVPLKWRGRTRIVFGITYLVEEYSFKNEEDLEYELYTNLQDRNLRSLNGTLYLVHSLRNRRFLLLRTGLEVNGDYTRDEVKLSRRSKFSAAGLWGWKPNPFTSYGFGIYYSYAAGGPSIYPAFLWNRTYNSRWGVEGVLPANFRVRYNVSEKTIFMAGYQVEGASYHIKATSPPLQEINTLELRKSDAKFFIEYEQEIYDYIWFGLRAGYRINANFDIAENNTFNEGRIIDNKVGESPFIGVSLFLVPPRKLMAKFAKPNPAPTTTETN